MTGNLSSNGCRESARGVVLECEQPSNRETPESQARSPRGPRLLVGPALASGLPVAAEMVGSCQVISRQTHKDVLEVIPELSTEPAREGNADGQGSSSGAGASRIARQLSSHAPVWVVVLR